MTELNDYSKYIRILVISLIIGILFNAIIFGKTLGINYLLFVLAFYIGFFILVRRDNIGSVKRQWLWLIPIALLSLTYLIYSNGLFMVLNFIAVPILIAVHTILTAQKNKHKWYTKEFAGEVIVDTLGYPFVNMGIGAKTVSDAAKQRTASEKYNTIKKVLLGLAIALPLVLVLILLLSSADAVFGHYIGEIPKMLFTNNPIEFITRLLLIIIITFYLFGYLYELTAAERKNTAAITVKHEKVFVLDSVITITVLSAINIIYIMFVFIQFSYLFSGAQAALPAGYTYAEYARKGFFELVLVTIINLSILVAVIKYMSNEKGKLFKAIKILLFMLVACTLIMLVSAYTRLGLYEQVYGYTYLRVLVHAFMIYLFALFIAAVYKLIRDRESLFRLFAIISIIAFMAINYANIDRLIAEQNIDRYNQTGKIDVYYFANLSYDSVEYMVPLLQLKNQQNRDVVEGILYDKREQLKADMNWQSFNLSRQKAWSLVKDLQLSPKDYSRDYSFE